MKMKKYILAIVVLNLVALCSFAQDKELGDKEYVIVKDYKPVLAESNKISDSPDGDTSYSNPPKMNYEIAPKKLETNFEAGVIRAVKIKEEPIAKLYHSLAKLGLGSYNAYTGEYFYNSLRSKTVLKSWASRRTGMAASISRPARSNGSTSRDCRPRRPMTLADQKPFKVSMRWRRRP